MVTPPNGDYESVPLNQQGQKVEAVYNRSRMLGVEVNHPRLKARACDCG